MPNLKYALIYMKQFRNYIILGLREPLLHFLLLGAGLFWLYNALNENVIEDDPQTIVVDRDKLLTYIQYRSKSFQPDYYGKMLDTMPEPELRQVINNYVREEAMYREAKALQLDRNDYIARLRLIQQLEFITRGFIEAVGPELSEASIAAYYQAHQENYQVAPKVTFTHVFFNAEKRDPAEAEAQARQTLARLNSEQVAFEKAPGYGDRFYYHVNYVQKEPEEVISHFGRDLWQSLEQLTPNQNLWYGPFRSNYGYHLVMLVAKSSAYIPELAHIRDKVIADLRREQEEKQFDAAIQGIVDTYRVKTDKLRSVDASINASSRSEWQG